MSQAATTSISDAVASTMPAAAPSQPAVAPISSPTTVEQMQVRVNRAVETGKDFIKKREKKREARRKLFLDILTLEYEYKAADESTQAEFDKIVDDRCATAEYTNNSRTTFAHKVAKLALNNNPQDVNALVHVINVAFALNVPTTDALEWLEKSGWFQGVRTGFYQDGTRKNNAETGQDNNKGTNSRTYPVEMPEITFVKEKLSGATLGQVTVDQQMLGEDFANVTEDTECAIIATYHPNGTMTIRGVVKNVEATYDSYFRANYPNGIPATKAQVQALLDKEKITTEEFRLIVGEKGVEDCNAYWEYVKDQKDWLNNPPNAINDYLALIRLADRKPEDNGDDIYEDAVDQLLDAIEDNPNLTAYLDRHPPTRKEFVEETIGRETVPRLITSKSIYNQAKSDDANMTKQSVMRMQLVRLLNTSKG